MQALFVKTASQSLLDTSAPPKFKGAKPVQSWVFRSAEDSVHSAVLYHGLYSGRRVLEIDESTIAFDSEKVRKQPIC
jgi:hypothetical protein